MKVAIIMGSDSDFPVVENGYNILKDFGVEVDVRVLSAHRTPDEAINFAKNAEANGYEVIIGAAGKAAHLPGVLAGCTPLPVIGIPVKAALEGMDALLSIVQMPKSIPVATVGINNSYNAGMLAVQMLSIKYPEIKAKLIEQRAKMKKNFIEENGEGVDL